jgi:hypothetical protein
MTKTFTDKDTYNLILNTLNNNGINKAIIKQAKMMNVDLVRIFYEKIFIENIKSKLFDNKDVIVKTLLGIYGNYVATEYYKALGYDVFNEYGVYKDANFSTRADIAFYDADGNLNLCEVKAAHQIIDNIRNYNSDNEEKYNGKYYYDMDNDIIKYKEIAAKLIAQVKKLKASSDFVTVVIFAGCFMDDIVKDKLNKLGVKIFTISVNINELETQIKEIVSNVVTELKNDNLKQKGYTG